MSDTIPTLDTPTSAEPAATTADIIESAIADLPDEGGDVSDVDESHDTPANITSGDPGATPTPAEIDELAQALGISGEGKAKWGARVPYSKIHKAWKEVQAKAKAEHEAALQQRDARLRDVEAVERLIIEQPEQFVRALVEQNPVYRQYFAGAGMPGTSDASGDMPQPDIRLADGTQTYSVDGLRRLLAWNTQQADQRVSQRLQPIERERQQREMIESAIPRVKQQLAEAQKWPLFSESKAEILAVLQSDPNVDLTSAYQRVVVPKLAGNRDQIRQDVLRELGQRPHSTSVTRTTGGRTEDNAPRDSRDVILQAIAGLD